MSIGLAFRDSLRTFFGPAQNVNAQFLGSGQTLYYSPLVASAQGGTYVLLYGFSLAASSNAPVDIQFVDASATATGVAPTWRTKSLGVTTTLNYDFLRPIPFYNGLVFSYTASGANTLNFNMQWGIVVPGA